MQSSRKVLSESTDNVCKPTTRHDDNNTQNIMKSPTKRDSTFNSILDATAKESAINLANKSSGQFDPSIEPLLKENPKRFVIFPIKYHDIWQMYKKVYQSYIHYIDEKLSHLNFEFVIGGSIILDSGGGEFIERSKRLE